MTIVRAIQDFIIASPSDIQWMSNITSGPTIVQVTSSSTRSSAAECGTPSESPSSSAAADCVTPDAPTVVDANSLT